MYLISKRMEVAAAHNLNLPYESKCTNCHGHNYIITVYLMSEELNEVGMVADFAIIKKQIHEVLDHHYLNDILPNNPTAEHMAYWIANKLDECYNANICYRCDVQESEGNIAYYFNEGLCQKLKELGINAN